MAPKLAALLGEPHQRRREVRQVGPGVLDVERARIGEAAACRCPWRSRDRTRSRCRRRRNRRRAARSPACRGRRPPGCAARSRRACRPCAWSDASACFRRAPAACRGRNSRRCPETAGSRRCLRPRRLPNRRATARSCRHSVITGLSAFSTTSQPCAASTACVARHDLDRLRSGAATRRRGRDAPGLCTCQPASRKASAAA